MSFKRTPDQICDTLKGGITDFPEAEIMSVFYETTPEAVKEILPPGLVPYERPLVIAGFNNFARTNFEVPYREAAMYVAAVHEKTGKVGLFVPGMTLDVDMGSILGREVGGYPKKWGKLTLNQTETTYEASAARHGVEYYKIKVDLNGKPNDPEIMQKIAGILTPPDPENHPGATIIYNYLWPASQWAHLENIKEAPNPILYTVWKTKTPGERKPVIGTGEVIFTHSEHDPWDSLPVVNTLGAIMTYDGIALDGARTPEDEYAIDPEAYLPYAFYGFDHKLDY
jgi:acetoacetate decarboxylase